MNTTERTQEQISALADGEVDDGQLDIVLAALRNPSNRADWELYHRIGDALRSDDMAFSLSDNFAAKMAARLESEPTIIAPAIAANMPEDLDRGPIAANAVPRKFMRFAVPGVAAAAVATAVFITTPHLLVAQKDAPSKTTAAPVIMMASAPAVVNVSSASAPVAAPMENQEQGVMLRDPRIDEYLFAHQRFSPSVFSTAQYARSATFASDSGK